MASRGGGERSIHVRRQIGGVSLAGTAGPRSGVSADIDGSERTAVLDSPRRKGRLTQENARGSLGTARGHRHTRHRQLHRASAAVYRRRSDEPAPSGDSSRRGLPIRSGAEAGSGGWERGEWGMGGGLARK